ncbi:hypothetical protein SISNIDRAFT_481241 [Sistotremastrum niveocremeum HHB9708]|uniref:Thioredoxin domain-containing protein n=1 Tax=Sistotremastrum niveocremeum HHB9708 TaxID=1314777 RepID=A0A165A5P2_9AGAM|nr:hypothetical protein SISNIDRAFT_481241 [Sistotremastrum niveocremeum HHB9708]
MHSSSDLSHRWPRPDPDDPLAPLWILRGQSSPCSQSICTLPSGTCLDSGTSLSSISSRLEHPSAPNATPLTVLPNVRDRRRRPKDPAPSQTSFRAHVADTFSHLSTTYLFRPKDAATKDVVRPASIADSGWFETLSDDRPRTPPHLSPRGRKAYRASQFRARADEPPTMTQLHHAASLKVFDADGRAVRFGKLWEDKRTIVCFIRHFLCPMCQDYMRVVANEAIKENLDKARVNLVIIGCGSPAMIKSYLAMHKLDYPIYTDPTLELYHALGMTLESTDAGSVPPPGHGHYVQHGVASGTIAVIGRAIRHGMPLLADGGKIGQLGGELIVGPGLRCGFAHRMSTTAGHTPVRHLLIRAGVQTGPFLRDTKETIREWMPRRREEEELTRRVDEETRRAAAQRWF